MYSNILNISLGTRRTFILTHKESKLVQKIPMPDNSIFVLGWKTNMLWHHCVNRENIDSSRISIVLRDIDTFINSDGKIFGQGGICKKEQDLDRYQDIDQKTEVAKLLNAFRKENGTDFIWEREYSSGFNIKCLRP